MGFSALIETIGMRVHFAAELPMPVCGIYSATVCEHPDLGLSLHHFMPQFTTRQCVTANRKAWRPKVLSGWNMLCQSV